GVPGQAPVLAVDLGDHAREADPLVAPGVDGPAEELEVHGHRAGDAPDGQLAVDLPLGLAVPGPDPGAAEADGGVLVGAEEVVGPQVAVTGGVPAVDGGGVELDLQGRRLGYLGDGGDAADVGELAPDLGHQVAGDELERLVGGDDLPAAGLGDGPAIDDTDPRGGGDCLSHVVVSLSNGEDGDRCFHWLQRTRQDS